MTDQKPPLRDRVARLRKDPRIAAFSLIGPGGQVFDLVNELVADLEQLQRQVAGLEKWGATLSGIASCATQCGCCRMHAELAQQAIGGR
jgi:hypothetical protein